MSTRDRIIVMVVAVVVVLGGAWMLLVSPKRSEASKLATQVGEARAQVQQAEGQLKDARSAQAQYASAYSSLVSLGKAVPAAQEVPSLIYEISQASSGKHVEFSSIASSTSGSSGSAGSGPSGAGATAASAAASAGFTQMPFTFVFEGGFFQLEHLFSQLSGFTQRTAKGLQVNGRLLTIQSIKLAPASAAGSASGAHASSGRTQKLSGTITATAYVLPAGQGVSGGATAGSPAGSAAPASSSSSSTSPAPAVVKVTP